MYFNICAPFMLFFVLCNCLVAGGLKKTVSDIGSIPVKVYLQRKIWPFMKKSYFFLIKILKFVLKYEILVVVLRQNKENMTNLLHNRTYWWRVGNNYRWR